MDAEATQTRKEHSPITAHILRGLAIVSMLVSALGVLATLVLAGNAPGGVTAYHIIGLVGTLLLGVVIAGALMGLAALVAAQHSSAAHLAKLADELGPRGIGGMPFGGRTGALGSPTGLTGEREPDIDKVVAVLEDIRRNTLLPDDRRRAKYERWASSERAARTSQVRTYLEAGRFDEARSVLAAMVDQFGEDGGSRGLAEKLEGAAREAAAKDLAAAAPRINELINAGSWDGAERLAQELADKHHTSPAARELVSRVRAQRAAHVEQRRTQLFAEIDRLTTEREWIRALDAALGFVATYPDAPETTTLRPRLKTLEENAEIMQRQRLEEQITQLVHEHRYRDAAQLARTVVERYPDSPQAKALREQISKLEQRASRQPTA